MSFYGFNDKSFTLISLMQLKEYTKERSIVSSIKSKFDNGFFVDLHVLYKFSQFEELAEQFQVHTTHKSTKNQSSIFRLIEKNYGYV